MLVIGSQALKKLNLVKDCTDLDIICTEKEFKEWIEGFKQDHDLKGVKPLKAGKYLITLKDYAELHIEGSDVVTRIIEVELAREGTTAKELLDEVGDGYADLDTLYMLKRSHKYLKDSPHFLKTMQDLQIMEMIGAKIPTHMSDWFVRREKETYHYKLPSLDTTKDKFFNKEESFYEFDHDDIHKAVALGSKPAYLNFLEEGQQVKCSKDMFFSLTEQQKLNAVVEESMVLALERSYIPNRKEANPSKPFDNDYWFEFALKKVCTSITSGWFREYAWDNYNRAVALYKFSRIDYVSEFESTLFWGYISPFNGDK